MFAHALKIKKGVNGGALSWFCSAREPPLLKFPELHVYCPVTCPSVQPRGEHTTSSLFFILLLPPG